MTETRTDQEARDKVFKMIQGIEVAMMVTQRPDGHLHARPMRAVQAKESDGALWFFTSLPSPKTEEIKNDQVVLLTYADPSNQNYVSISGRAEVIHDVARQKELWSEPLRAWFPGGPEDPKAGLIRVKVEGAEYWDAPSSTLVHAYGYVKAALTGEPPKPGDNDKVAFGKSA